MSNEKLARPHEILRRRADVLRAELDRDAEQCHRAAVDLVAVGQRFATVDPETSMILASAYHHSSFPVVLLLMGMIERAGELSAVSRSLDLLERGGIGGTDVGA